MPEDLTSAALDYHEFPRPGKLSVELTTRAADARDLSLAYSPGVAAPVRAIAENQTDAYRYTNKGNLVAVISNGTAILGLGDLGAIASKPVMEGKGLCFATSPASTSSTSRSTRAMSTALSTSSPRSPRRSAASTSKTSGHPRASKWNVS